MSTLQAPKDSSIPNAGTPDYYEREQLLRDAATLRAVLEADIQQGRGGAPGHPFLVALSGLPGTGKSHFARELVKRVPFLVLESDRLRKALVEQPRYTRGEHARLFAACHLLIEDYLAQSRRVLFDATNLTESYRQPLYDIAERLSVPLALVRFTAPRNTIRRRLRERAAGLDPGNYSDADWLIYCRLLPGEEPVQREHFNVDSSGDISPALEEIVRLIESTNSEKP